VFDEYLRDLRTQLPALPRLRESESPGGGARHHDEDDEEDDDEADETVTVGEGR